MKIALIGYGKMGKAIEKMALADGHEILLKISSANLEELTPENIKSCDVAIEFTKEESAVKNIKMCFDAAVPVVSGSTGWLQHYDEILAHCKKKNGSFLYASNFSVGVQLFFALNKKLAKLMSSYPEYQTSLKEIHHTEKKDAPSGTAITLAEDIIKESPSYKNWVNKETTNQGNLSITSLREDPAPGRHEVTYKSSVDEIEIIHTAHNRVGFAKGALLAAGFLITKKGIFTMQDVMGI